MAAEQGMPAAQEKLNELAESRGLFLSGLTHLSDTAAESLSKHCGMLYLAGLMSLSDRAADFLSVHSGTVNLCHVRQLSDGAVALLAGSGVELPEEFRIRAKELKQAARAKKSPRVDKTVATLDRAGFFKYVSAVIPDLTKLSYPDDGIGGGYAVITSKGESMSVRRAFGADVEELVVVGLSYFFRDDLSHLGIDATSIAERHDQSNCEWEYGGTIYTVCDETISDSRYSRAACALVTILNRILEHNGSDERAFGVNEGNAFGVAFLTEPLRKVIAKLVNAEQTPQPQKQLEQILKKSIAKNETPFVRSAG